MRKWYLLPIALIFGDLAIFMVLRQLGVLRLGHIPPNWVKVAFFAPLGVASLVAVCIVLCGAKAGVTYDFTGGAKVKFSNEPLRFVICFTFQLVAFMVAFVIFTSIMFGYGT